MAEPALIAYLRTQIIAFREALGLRQGDILASKALDIKQDVLERYGLNPTLCAVLFDNNPEGHIRVSPLEHGTMAVSVRNKAELLITPNATNSLLYLCLKHEDEHGKELSRYLGRKEALKVINSPVLNNADAFLRRIWRLDAPEGITEEYRNAQALIWSVEHLAHEQGLLKKPLHPRFDRDILTI